MFSNSSLETDNRFWLSKRPNSLTSPIHRLDPRLRIIAALAFAVVVVLGRNFSMLIISLILAASLASMARLSFLKTLKCMISMDMFVIAMLLMLPFTLPGETVFQIGPLAASREGLLRAGEIGLKANAVILTLLTLVGTIEVATLGHALYHLRVPEKLIHLFLFTVRYIEVLDREYQRLRLAMKARAFVPRSNWHTWRSFGYLLGMLLVRSLERSERVLAAMKCRGFRGQYPILHHFAMSSGDWLFMAGFTASLAILLGLELA